VLHYTPDTLGKTMVCDLMFAYVGHHAERFENIKIGAAIARTATTILLNIQLPKGKKVTAQQLWPFPWEQGDTDDVKDKEEAARKFSEDLATIREWKKKKRSVKDGDGNK
jgi:hypothetical protein